MTPHSDFTSDLIVLALLVAFKLLDALSTARRDRKRGETLELRLTELKASFDAGLARLQAFIIGPDGTNGMRGDLDDLTERVKAVEGRELADLRAAAEKRQGQAMYDRRSGT